MIRLLLVLGLILTAVSCDKEIHEAQRPAPPLSAAST